MISHRTCIAPAILATTLSVFGSAAFGQQFPARQITILGQFGPASPPEVEARLMAPFLASLWGQAVVVESKPGAGGLIAVEQVIKAPADGYTLLSGAAAIATYTLLVKDMRFDPIRDLEPVSIYAEYPGGFVTNTQVPARTIEEFVAYAKTNAGKLNYASVGRSTTVFTVELLKALTGMQLTEIPHKTAADFQTSLLRNETQLLNTSFSEQTRAQIAGGLPMRPLLTIGEQRSSVFPDVPTTREKGWYIPRNGWYALFAPKGTPKPVLDQLAAGVARYTQSAEAQKRAKDLGVLIRSTTPDELRQLIDRDSKAWSDIAQQRGIKPE
jgi:tripartite-type tricarboxylate transporter receptor subunit TctC